MDEIEFEALIEAAEVDLETPVSSPPVALSAGEFEDFDGKMQELPIVTYGNFAFIAAPQKTGKSFFSSLLVAAYLGCSYDHVGELKGHNPENRGVLHIDTEQSRFHAAKMFRRQKWMKSEYQDRYKCFSLRAFGIEERIGFIEYYLKHNHRDVGLIMLDGVADLLYDNNDIKMANEVVQKLMRWTELYNIALITVIHTNDSKDNPRPTGHIGSFLQKKAETQLRLSANDGFIDVECKESRNQAFPPFSFAIQKGLPYIVPNDYPI